MLYFSATNVRIRLYKTVNLISLDGSLHFESRFFFVACEIPSFEKN